MKYLIEIIRFILLALLLLMLGDFIVLLTVILTKVAVIIGIGWLLVRLLANLSSLHRNSLLNPAGLGLTTRKF